MPNILSVTNTFKIEHQHYIQQINIKQNPPSDWQQVNSSSHNIINHRHQVTPEQDNRINPKLIFSSYFIFPVRLSFPGLLLLHPVIFSLHWWLVTKMSFVHLVRWINNLKAFRICFLFTFNPRPFKDHAKFVRLPHDPILLCSRLTFAIQSTQLDQIK